jgi:O-antigen chain-terminating methyltransferase
VVEPAEVEDLALYHANVFRGDPAEIKRRLSVYVPYARNAFAATAQRPALDLGCGRGEWLELMRNEDIPAVGVDSSGEMIRVCSNMGLKVERAEMLSFLRGVPDDSLSALTAFHVVEHLAFSDLTELVDQAVRVLKPGGLAIFETPNPRNVFVGTNSFYLDPTHTQPLPSELLSYLAELRGLCEVETVFLHPYPESFHLAMDHCDAARFINEKFYGPQDYAIIARRV